MDAVCDSLKTTRNSTQEREFKSKKIFVSFTSKDITAKTLRKIFSAFGKLRQAYLCNSKSSLEGTSSGIHRYGFVTFQKYENVLNVLKLRCIEHEGMVIKIKAIKYKEKYKKNKKRSMRRKNMKSSLLQSRQGRDKIGGFLEFVNYGIGEFGTGHSQRQIQRKNPHSKAEARTSILSIVLQKSLLMEIEDRHSKSSATTLLGSLAISSTQNRLSGLPYKRLHLKIP